MSGVHRQPVRMENKGALLSSICSLITQGIESDGHIAVVVRKRGTLDKQKFSLNCPQWWGENCWSSRQQNRHLKPDTVAQRLNTL